MQDFAFGKIKAQETMPEPYTLYNKENREEVQQGNAILRDFEYFRSMYPMHLKTLQLHVEKACDEMDYKGSPIYDEYPDRVIMEQMCKGIEEKLAGTEQKSLAKAQASTEKEERIMVEAHEVGSHERMPRTPLGPEGVYSRQTYQPQGYKTWEWDEAEMQHTQELQKSDVRSWGPQPGPWGPPPGPWGPPPGPWGWGPQPGPWGPPGRPCGPPGRPCGPIGPGDVISLLLFNELQRRRCNNRRCW